MKPTKHSSFIPLTPDARPSQRLNEVVCLPDKPNGLDISIDWKTLFKESAFQKAHQES